MNVEIDERIWQLQEEQKEIGQKVADQEQILYMLEEFIRFKLDKVSETINSQDRKSTRLNSSHSDRSRMPSSA